MSKIAFIYPGQGAQKCGMGQDFYENSASAKAVYDMASEVLKDNMDIDMKDLCFHENDKLDLTEYTQAALVTTCLAMTKVVEEAGIHPDVTAGLSLGEYCAIAVAGGMKDEDAVRLVRKRGLLMQNTVPAGEGAMCAIIGMTGEEIEKGIEGMEGVTIANYNCPGQIVITGETKAVEEAAGRLKEAGARRTIMLNVSGPFHSPMLKKAGEELAEVLKDVTLSPLKIPYVTNVDAQQVTDIALTKDLLARQVSSSVRWQQSMENLIADGVDVFVEIGPGRTLAGFMRKISRDVRVYNVGTWADVEKLVENLNQ